MARKSHLHKPRRCLVLSSSILLLLVLQITTIAAFANTGTIDFSTASKYNNAVYSTSIGWNNVLYGDSVNYAVGSDSHINFTNFSVGSSSNPSLTFGVASQNGNANISAIQTNYIRFIGATQASKILNLTFYYTSLPAQVDVGQPSNTTISSTSYYTTYSLWVAAPSPAVYDNVVSKYLMVKSAYATPTIQFDTAPRVTQPIKVTFASSGAPSPTFTISGCGVLNSTFLATTSGYTHTYTGLLPSCALTITVPSSGMGTRYGMKSGALSGNFTYFTWYVTTCASDTCPLASNSTYYQVQNTYIATPTSPIAWDGAYSVGLIGNYLGVVNKTIDTEVTANAGGAITFANEWTNYNAPISIQRPIGASWAPLGNDSFIDTTSGHTHNVNYQLPVTTTTPYGGGGGGGGGGGSTTTTTLSTTTGTVVTIGSSTMTIITIGSSTITTTGPITIVNYTTTVGPPVGILGSILSLFANLGSGVSNVIGQLALSSITKEDLIWIAVISTVVILLVAVYFTLKSLND